jgi:hypothetical protein
LQAKSVSAHEQMNTKLMLASMTCARYYVASSKFLAHDFIETLPPPRRARTCGNTIRRYRKKPIKTKQTRSTAARTPASTPIKKTSECVG